MGIEVSAMLNNKIRQLRGLLSPSRFLRHSNKIINFIIIIVALPLTVVICTVKSGDLTSKFTDLYSELMPRDMLITYRGCLFRARQGKREIYHLHSESEPLALKRFNPNEGDIIVDLGAYVGKYTLPSAKLAGDEGHVIAVEPVPENYEALKKNIELNDFSNVTALNAAAYDKNQDMLLVGWALEPLPVSDHPEAQHVNSGEATPVEAVTMDSILEEQNIQSVDYVKIDIDEGELNAIRGMKKTLRASDEVTMRIEIRKGDFKEIDNLLTELGFRGTPINEWGTSGIRDFMYEKKPPN